mmetsp:Transcript_103895/g.292369  ORF Transcript_103895/g.292369 Transcript_103895/m.292369 type:complete len:187 (-) Transcript_103895:193-753(-)
MMTGLLSFPPRMRLRLPPLKRIRREVAKEQVKVEKEAAKEADKENQTKGDTQTTWQPVLLHNRPFFLYLLFAGNQFSMKYGQVSSTCRCPPRCGVDPLAPVNLQSQILVLVEVGCNHGSRGQGLPQALPSPRVRVEPSRKTWVNHQVRSAYRLLGSLLWTVRIRRKLMRLWLDSHPRTMGNTATMV